MAESDKRFTEAVMPHLDAAYNLARWMLRNDADAADAAQEACLRALRFIGTLRGEDGRLWLLKIVRNVCYSRLAAARKHEQDTEFDDDLHFSDTAVPDPEALLLRSRDAAAINRALEELPVEFREVLVMRELEGLSYKAIAEVAGVPLGTVMSRLARGRRRLQRLLSAKRDLES